jgi:nitrate reductase (NAD(P)H)
MERVKKAGGNLTNGRWGEKLAGDKDVSTTATEPVAEVKMTKPGVDLTISLEELRAHESETAPWFVINGEVYDGTPFLNDHPGGATSIIATAGQDCTDEFMAIRRSSSILYYPLTNPLN